MSPPYMQTKSIEWARKYTFSRKYTATVQLKDFVYGDRKELVGVCDKSHKRSNVLGRCYSSPTFFSSKESRLWS